MIKGIGHVAFYTQNMDKALQFYCGILGFEKAFTLNSADGQPWIQYLLLPGGQFLELFYGRSNTNENSSYAHLCLEVDDIQEIAAHMRKNNIPLTVEPNQGMDTNWQCWVKDPDGNPIEFMQIMPTSPQAKAQSRMHF